MTTLLDLPEALLHLIFRYLDGEALRAVNLAVKGWSTLTVRHRCRHLNFNTWSPEVKRTIALLEYLDSCDLLKHVQRLTINDTGGRSHDGEAALQDSLGRLMPFLTGLKVVQWDTSGKSERLDDGFRPPKLPPGVLLEIRSIKEMHVHRAMSTWFDAQTLPNLHRLTVQYSRKRAPWSGLLEAALIKCECLRALSIMVGDPSTTMADYSAQDNDTGLHWSPDQVRRLSALEELEFHDSGVADETYATWAESGDWSRLRRLTVSDDRLLKHLARRTPRLEALSTSTAPSLRECLAECPGVSELRITGLGPRNVQSDEECRLYDVLELSFAQKLQIFEVTLSSVDAAAARLRLSLQSIASSAPKLKELMITLGPKQLQSMGSVSRWCETVAEAIARLPDLYHFTMTLPRVYHREDDEISVIITMTSLEQLWDCLSARGKRLQQLHIVTIIDNEVPSPCALPPTCKALTFSATSAVKDWDALKGKHISWCPELSSAKAALLRGNLSYFGDNISYTAARKMLDDMTALAENGIIVPKKKPRPMPVWLTPEEEQDRREGPPNWRRRAKRAAMNGMVDFFGGFRAPGTEYPGRTRAEKANARESGYGGRPGWSKSSLATRVVWRR